MNFKKVSLSLLTTALVLTGSCTYAEESKELFPSKDPVEEPVEIVEEVPVKVWVGNNFNQNEQEVLKFFQEYGIKDRMALAVLLGNIKQESGFVPNICEGGARVTYQNCHRGGYGLIQWTTTGRYMGLGYHANKIGGNPSTLQTQLSYLVTEKAWKDIEYKFRNPNKSLSYYMGAANYWLGWGIYGSRGYFSQQYYDRLTLG